MFLGMHQFGISKDGKMGQNGEIEAKWGINDYALLVSPCMSVKTEKRVKLWTNFCTT